MITLMSDQFYQLYFFHHYKNSAFFFNLAYSLKFFNYNLQRFVFEVQIFIITVIRMLSETLDVDDES